MDQWLARDHEMEFFRRELDSFVPDRIFDAYVHFYDLDFFPEEDVLDLMRNGPPTVGMDVFQEYIGQITLKGKLTLNLRRLLPSPLYTRAYPSLVDVREPARFVAEGNSD